MKVYNYLTLLLFSLAISSCEQSALPGELVRYVVNPENGLKKIKSVGDLKMGVQYKPVPFIIANELRKNDISPTEYETRAADLKSLQHYNLQLSVNEPGVDITNYGLITSEAQQGRLYYLSFQMKNDIKLVDGKDTLSPVLYHFERSYDLADHRNFVLAFEDHHPNISDDKTLILQSETLGTGPVKVKISGDDLQRIPNLKLR